jgi:subfamily B ATP-binding cassette protein MsbA
LNAFNFISNQNSNVELNQFKNEIYFKNISFSFGEKKVINNINLKIRKGSKVAIVGESGSGKTTLINLLNRFYDVKKGEILIDGVNIKKISKRSLRNCIGLVTQEPILFNDTVNNNISLGKEEHGFDEIISAAKTSNAHNFIVKLKEKYNTNIGDGGGKLSGGQKQRISIARAVLKDPQILLMDEATSSLDSVSEKMVQDAIEKLSKNRTTIIVAHRLNTIQKADLIVVMGNGKIIQTGTHKKLISIKGKYKQLVEMQTFQK